MFDRERRLDEALAESFPASDPPSWTLGLVRPRPVARAAQSASAAAGAIDVSPPLGSARTFFDGLVSLAAASGLVLLVPFAILLVGVPIALLVRGLLEAFSWLLAFVVP